VDSLLQEMTLAEKIGQMTQTHGNFEYTGPVTADPNTVERLQKGELGSFLNVFGAARTREAQEMALAGSRLGIPLIFGYDMIHGYATIFPIPLAEAASWDLDLVRRSAEITALEAAASGVHWNFAPMVDISRDPRWGRIMEGAGDDPWWAAQVAAARVRGYQGENLYERHTIAATAKHFAAYGAAEGGRDYNSTELSERTLREIYLPPFKASVDAGVATIMTGFNDLNGIPASASPLLMKQILKGEWGFRGFVVSDWASIQEMTDHGYAGSDRAAARLSLQAGCDMEMVSTTYGEYLEELVQEDPVYLTFIDDAVRRILGVKYDLGLFEDPFRYCDPGLESEVVLNEAHFRHAREIARESIVLLENRNQTLPLQRKGMQLAVIGPLADDPVTPLGTWSAQGKAEDVTTLLASLKAGAGKDTRITYTAGCDVNSSRTDGFEEALRQARSADVILAVVGEEAMMSGEALSRSNLGLPGVQLDLLKALHSTGKPLVVILMNGRPIAEPWMYENCDAILEAWHLGVQSGPAITDVLFGAHNPGGKLPVTIPRSVGQVPLYYNHKNTGRPFDPDDRYTSKYIDEQDGPQYPFGYGLSYTRFEYGDLKLNQTSLQPGETLQVEVTVRNAGSFDGTEVVQLYVQDLVGSVTRPVKELKGFAKLYLGKGESQTVRFLLTVEDLRFWDRNMAYTWEAGEFKVYVGSNSRDLLSADFKVLDN